MGQQANGSWLTGSWLTGVGQMGVGKAGVDQMGVGQMVPNPIYCYSFYLAATQYSTVPKKRN